jgi:hypothetical protein
MAEARTLRDVGQDEGQVEGGARPGEVVAAHAELLLDAHDGCVVEDALVHELQEEGGAEDGQDVVVELADDPLLVRFLGVRLPLRARVRRPPRVEGSVVRGVDGLLCAHLGGRFYPHDGGGAWGLPAVGIVV